MGARNRICSVSAGNPVGPRSRVVTTAQDLRLRAEPSPEALATHIMLPRGTSAELISTDPSGWVQIRAQTGDGRARTGWCMHRALGAALQASVPVFPAAERRMWDLVQLYTGRVGYRRGTKTLATGVERPVIDCSGWVALMLSEAMAAQNADAGEDVFDNADIAACNAWSDRIILEIEVRTPMLLEGPDVTSAKLARCATIGVNEGYFNWQENHPRLRGINHIAQVLRRPADQAPFVSESYSTGPGGVRLTPLADWLDANSRHIRDGRAWAVDPFAMARPAVPK